MISIEGKVVFVKEHLIPKNNLLTIKTNSLTKGLYTIEIGDELGEKMFRQFMKTKWRGSLL